MTRGLAIAGVAAAVGGVVTVPAQAAAELNLFNVGMRRCADGNQQAALYVSVCSSDDPGQNIQRVVHEDGTWQMRHVLSGRCFENLTSDIRKVELRSCTASPAQRWSRIVSGDGYWLINVATGQALDANQTSMYALPRAMSTHQAWVLSEER